MYISIQKFTITTITKSIFFITIMHKYLPRLSHSTTTTKISLVDNSYHLADECYHPIGVLVAETWRLSVVTKCK